MKLGINSTIVAVAIIFSTKESHAVTKCVRFGCKLSFAMFSLKHRFQYHKDIILLAVGLAVLLFLLRWLEVKFLIIDFALEVYIGAIAVLFTALGIWLALKLSYKKPQTIIVEKEIYVSKSADFKINELALQKVGLSKREMDVLGLLADGLSNEEVAEKLFISLNTVKTHTSKLFEKMEVKRRTQAVEKGKRLGLIP